MKSMKFMGIAVALLCVVAETASAQTLFTLFKNELEKNGYNFRIVEVFANNGDLIGEKTEPFLHAEGEVFIKNEQQKIIEVVTYIRKITDQKPNFSKSIFWIVCDKKWISFTNSITHKETIDKETSGYDVLGGKLPDDIRGPLSLSDYYSLGMSLPKDNLIDMKKTSINGSEDIKNDKIFMLNSVFSRYCN